MPNTPIAAGWRITKVHHLGLTVADIERSIRFYRDLLGLRLMARRQADAAYVGEQTGYPGLRLEVASFLTTPESDQLLQLAQYITHAGEPADQASNRPGNTHLCLQVDDIHAAYRDLSSQGVRFKTEPVVITAGPHQGGFGAYLFDPDGYTIELHQPVSG